MAKTERGGHSLEDQLAERRRMHAKRQIVQSPQTPPVKKARKESTKWEKEYLQATRNQQIDALASSSGQKRFAFDFADDDDVKIKPEAYMKPNLKPADRTTMRYQNGALRLTRTSGRASNRNAVGWKDIFEKDSIVGMFSNFFFIENDALFRHLPLGHGSRKAEIIIGRDIRYDDQIVTAASSSKTSFNQKEHQDLSRDLAKRYRFMHGPNYEAIYPKATGPVHSKMAAIKYLDSTGDPFLRLLITSCNAMEIDFAGGSNHHFIQDFPALKPGKRRAKNEFGLNLFSHLEELGCPAEFVDSLKTYDFSTASVSLILSHPGTHKDISALGLGRLGQLSSEVIQGFKTKKLQLESCTASVGQLPELWLHQAWHLLTGRPISSIPQQCDSDDDLPPIRIIYPTQTTGDRSTPEAREAASEMGCHANFKTRSKEFQRLFHDYKDKVNGLLTHQKQYLLLHPSSQTPLFLVFGSHNFSKNAFGDITFTKQGGEPRLKLNNFELSVFVKGEDIEGMLAPGSSWEDFVTYRRPAQPYQLHGPVKDRPFSSGAWGAGGFH
ncbi:phospholipase D/nuclease [Meredithblackwellia eburnea MCA 4105]